MRLQPAASSARRRPPWLITGAVSGLLVCVLWAPTLLVVPDLPDLRAATRITQLYREHGDLLLIVILGLSVGFLFLLLFLGALVEWLRLGERSGALSWVAFGSALMFMTALGVALGLASAARLLTPGPPEVIRALHTAAFVLAAPVALVGSSFFVAVAALSFRAGAFPRWLAWLAVACAAVNAGAIGGLFTTAGVLNSGNGAIGGIVAPLASWIAWILLASLTWLINGVPQSPHDVDQPAASSATKPQRTE